MKNARKEAVLALCSLLLSLFGIWHYAGAQGSSKVECSGFIAGYVAVNTPVDPACVWTVGAQPDWWAPDNACTENQYIWQDDDGYSAIMEPPYPDWKLNQAEEAQCQDDTVVQGNYECDFGPNKSHDGCMIIYAAFSVDRRWLHKRYGENGAYFKCMPNTNPQPGEDPCIKYTDPLDWQCEDVDPIIVAGINFGCYAWDN